MPEVRKVLDVKLDPKVLDKMKLTDRVALERQVLGDLIAKYPREFEPYQTLINMIRSDDPDGFSDLHNQFVKMAKDDPDDPLALLLAGRVLRGKNTPESVRLLEAAKAKAPNFPWPFMELASDYFGGKIADQNKVKENIEGFFPSAPPLQTTLLNGCLRKTLHCSRKSRRLCVRVCKRKPIRNDCRITKHCGDWSFAPGRHRNMKRSVRK